MPVYEYKCIECSYRFEELKKFSDMDKEEECPSCGSSHAERFMSSSSFRLSGSGWPGQDIKRSS